MTTDKLLTTIGKAEIVDFVELNIIGVPSRIDTGARTSAIWVSRAEVIDNVLQVVFFDTSSKFYQDKTVVFSEFDMIDVKTSTGEEQTRYVVKLQVRICGRKIRARFTLADRSTQVYPVLIGRNLLKGKFIVNVKQGLHGDSINISLTEKESPK